MSGNSVRIKRLTDSKAELKIFFKPNATSRWIFICLLASVRKIRKRVYRGGAGEIDILIF